ncbi:hypothetical protein [Chromatium okenii]|nr:hypothetical protein [Chromatium okenii]
MTPYEWRGFTILDTPGIDAPIEHEKFHASNWNVAMWCCLC